MVDEPDDSARVEAAVTGAARLQDSYDRLRRQTAKLVSTYKDKIPDIAEEPHDYDALMRLDLSEWVRRDPTKEVSSGKSAPSQLQTKFQVAPTKDEIIRVALRAWEAGKDVIHDDDALLTAIAAYGRGLLVGSLKRMDGIGREMDAIKEIVNTARDTGEEATAAAIAAMVRKLGPARAAVQGYDKEFEELGIATSFVNMCAIPDGQIQLIGAARWAENGFPQVELGAKFAAALLVTNVMDDVLKTVRPPWDSFFIEVPDGLLSIWDPQVESQQPIRRILVMFLDHPEQGPKWAYAAYTATTTTTLWRFGCDAAMLLPPSVDSTIEVEGLLEITEQDERVAALIGRLIITTCLAMSDPSKVAPTGKIHQEHANAVKKGRKFARPVVRIFKVGAPITLDFRERVQSYVHDGLKGRKLSVQSLVCGHFKGQHYGPKNSLYKIIWREPFWRGPDEAPIPMRTHKMDGDP